MYRLSKSIFDLFTAILCIVPLSAHADESSSQTSTIPAQIQATDQQTVARDGAQGTPPGRSEKLSSIFYNAQESIVLDLEQKSMHLHGAGIIKYEDVKLEAEHMSLNWPERTVSASGKTDASGHIEEKVVCTLNGTEYIAADVRYNFESHRAVANQLFTKHGDGIFRADKVKKDRSDTFYADRGMYTTCNLVEPHFHIDAQRVKMVHEDKAFSGPCRLYFNKVPTFLGSWFGLFYFPKGSGFVFPMYGGESQKGFCLKQGGYYFRFNDHIDLALLADLYSSGSQSYSSHMRYKKRYAYDGDIQYQWTRNHYARMTTLSKTETIWQLTWKHHTLNNRNSSLTAELDLRGGQIKDIPQYVSSREATQTHLNSSVRYHNALAGLPYILDVGLSHNKNFQTKEQDATLPSVNLQTSRMYPLRGRMLFPLWLQDVHIQHVFQAMHKVSTVCDGQRLDFTPKYWGILLRNSRMGAKHTVPLTTNIKIFRCFNLAPKAEYHERWYGTRTNYSYAGGSLVREEDDGFYRVWNYNVGASLRTTLRGLYRFGRRSGVQAIKHQVEPGLNFTYTPDFSTPFYGYWYTARNGKKLSHFEGSVYDVPPNRAQAVLEATIKNTLDAKLKSNQEDEETKPVSWLEACDWSVGYDFLADRFALTNIRVDTRMSPLGEKLRVNSKIVIDPYVWQLGGTRKIDQLVWHRGEGLGRIQSSSLQLQSTVQFGGAFPKRSPAPVSPADQADTMPPTVEYVRFVLPCKLHAAYDWTYTSLQPGNSESTRVLSLESVVDLTQKWKLSCKTAYDLTQEELVDTATRLGIRRDLHCWEMNFDWSPLGTQESYRFEIGVKSSLLKALRYDRERTYRRP